jgi:2-C-methyl-D-erythritol 4-phosphate cytidylyltransferase
VTVVVGIIPAGGSGERLGAERPKAFVVLAGKPLLEWSIEALHPVCDRVIAAVPAGQEEGPDQVAGGASRSESVRNAVEAAPDADVYVVHDAARPLASPQLVERCLRALYDGPWAGAVAGAHISDTVKQVGFDNGVSHTLDRELLRAIQTPQVFHAGLLRHALDVDYETLDAATDDASLVEAAGGRIRVVDAPPENIKVTTRADLKLAEILLGC